MLVKQIDQDDYVMKFSFSHPFLLFDVLKDALYKRSIAYLTRVLEVEEKVLSRLGIQVSYHSHNDALNFRLKQWRIDITDTKGDASLDEIGQEFTTVDLIAELNESIELVFQLWLKTFIPELIRDVLCDASIGEEHRQLTELLQIVIFNVTHGCYVQRIAKIAHVRNRGLVKFAAETATKCHAYIEGILASSSIQLLKDLIKDYVCEAGWDRSMVHDQSERNSR